MWSNLHVLENLYILIIVIFGCYQDLGLEYLRFPSMFFVRTVNKDMFLLSDLETMIPLFFTCDDFLYKFLLVVSELLK